MDPLFAIFCVLVMALVLAWTVKYLHDDHARSRERAQEAAEDYALQLRDYRLRKIPENLYENQMEVRRLRRSLEASVAGMAVKLDEAQRDFSQRAFSPFWDRVEEIALVADAFQKEVTRIGGLVDCDRRLVAEYRNLVGAVPTTAIDRYRLSPSLCGRGSLPSPASQLARLRELVRSAQCDIDFAMILESRKTRRAIQDSAQEVGARIDSLQSSIEGGFSRIEDLLLPGNSY